MARGSSTRDGSRTQGRARPATPPPIAARSGTRVKYALDRVLAALALVLTAPLFAAVAAYLLVRGRGRLLTSRPALGERGHIRVVSFAVPERKSAGGRVLVGSGLAALPQLWSVLRGDMSLVGPRPRFEGEPPPPARPGLVGLAQNAQARRDLELEELFALDDRYAREWSLALDARILGRCVWDALVPPR